MLPDSSLTKTGQINVAKFADTGVRELVQRLVKAGARMPFLKAKLAGGAQMFQFASEGFNENRAQECRGCPERVI